MGVKFPGIFTAIISEKWGVKFFFQKWLNSDIEQEKVKNLKTSGLW